MRSFFLSDSEFAMETMVAKSKVEFELADKDSAALEPRPSAGKQMHKFRILKRDIEKYEATPGCSACTETLMGRG